MCKLHFKAAFLNLSLVRIKPFKLALTHAQYLSETLTCLRGACYSMMVEKIDDQL